MILFTVAAPPRGGTMWFSEVFTTDRSHCFHQLTAILQPYPVNVVLNDVLQSQLSGYQSDEDNARQLFLQAYPDYLPRHWERGRLGELFAGNSDGATLALVRGLFLVWPRMKFILSIRDGIKWVQSICACENRLTPAERTIHERSAADDFFVLSCQEWTKKMELIESHKAWLRERDGDFIETRLEAITTDEAELRRVWDWLIGDWEMYAERNRLLMRRPMNTKANANGVTAPDEVWWSWNDAQREAFLSICGEVQLRLGYSIPGQVPLPGAAQSAGSAVEPAR